jgi:hypothetical protein
MIGLSARSDEVCGKTWALTICCAAEYLGTLFAGADFLGSTGQVSIANQKPSMQLAIAFLNWLILAALIFRALVLKGCLLYKTSNTADSGQSDYTHPYHSQWPRLGSCHLLMSSSMNDT